MSLRSLGRRRGLQGLGAWFLSWGLAALAAAEGFAYLDLAGEAHTLDRYQGRWVVVNYWASWCPPCIEEMGELDDFHRAHRDTDAVVLGVNSEDIGAEELREFVAEIGVSYPILRGEPIARAVLGRVPGLPTTFIVSPEGEVRQRIVGPVDRARLEQLIQ